MSVCPPVKAPPAACPLSESVSRRLCPDRRCGCLKQEGMQGQGHPVPHIVGRTPGTELKGHRRVASPSLVSEQEAPDAAAAREAVRRPSLVAAPALTHAHPAHVLVSKRGRSRGPLSPDSTGCEDDARSVFTC